MRALRHPALGLALTMLAVTALPAPLAALANLGIDDFSLPTSVTILMVLQVGVVAFQGATGWAIVTRRGAHVWFAAWFAACIALVVSTATLGRDEEMSALVALGAAFETIGTPVVVAAASLVMRDEDERSLGDVAAMLLVIVVRVAAVVPLQMVQEVPMMRAGSALGALVVVYGPAIAVAIPGAVAAIRLARGDGARALWVYVVASIGIHLALAVVGTVWLLVEDLGPRVLPLVIAPRIAGLVTLLGPLAIWSYARPILGATPAAAPSRLPIWIALTFVPTLLARVFVSNTLALQVGSGSAAFAVAIAATEATAILFGAEAALRERPSTRWWLLGAAIGAAAIFAAGAIYVHGLGMHAPKAYITPIGNLLAATATAAWLYRRRR